MALHVGVRDTDKLIKVYYTLSNRTLAIETTETVVNITVTTN